MIPDCAGVWLFRNEFDEVVELDVYPLEPVGGVLCFWGPDVGFSYTGFRDTQSVWTTDEWQGHIPVHFQEHAWIGPRVATGEKHE